MELLAPAGSKESFAAALRGGADSVYVGIKGYNARLYAKNLGFYDLEALIDHAHERGRKLYVTFNTLIKHGEIGGAVDALAVLERLGPDAIIVQDMGVARIVREYFPDLSLHASTQMAVHNSQGAALLKERGFERVILARELSFSELKLVAARSPVEVEAFCHGALCFSISGMCLFSSAIGGHSGNRGRCTQPCRRIWKGDEEKGYLFSPRDLELAEQLPKLRASGVAAIKIEGRMRSSDYVYRVVKAYRMLLDAPQKDFKDAFSAARKLLAADYARVKTTALFSGRDPKMFNPGETQCLGLRIGKIISASTDRLAVALDRVLERGDRLRFSDAKSDKTAVVKVKEFVRRDGRYELPYSGPAFTAGTPVFLAGDAGSDEKSFAREVDAVFAEHAKRAGRTRLPRAAAKAYRALLENQWSRKPAEARAERLWVRIDDAGWLDIASLGGCGADIVISLNRDNLQAFLKAVKDSPPAPGPAIFELPPYIGQRELPEFRAAVDTFFEAGYSRWVLNNVSHFGFFKEREAELTAGHFLYTWNAYAAFACKELGASRFVVSWEDDILNVTELCRLALRGCLTVYLYGFPPLARSRFLTKDMCGGSPVEEKPGLRFRRVYEAGSGLVIPDKPVSLMTARRKLAERGIDTFGIDLSFIAPDEKRWEGILRYYDDGKNPEDSIKFNFKRGVK